MMEGKTMKKSLLLISAFALCFSACNTLEPNSPEDVAPAIDDVQGASDSVVTEVMPDSFTAIAGDETKAGFDYDSFNKKYVHFWNDGDQIYVYHGNTRGTYTCSDAATGHFTKVADSEIAVTPTFDNYCAVYNTLSSTVYDPSANNKLTLAIGDSYTSGTDGYGNLMVACSNDETLHFTSIVGWLKLKLKGAKSVSSIQIYGTNYEKTWGTGVVTFNGDKTIGTSWDFSDNGNEVEFSTSIALNESTATSLYLALPPTNFTDGISLIVEYSDGTSSGLITSNSVAIEANKVTPMAALNIVKNLGATETANCYIVTPRNYYKFPAVQGNSATSVGSVDHVNVLWETKNDASAAPITGNIINNVSCADGYISFYAPNYNIGNALIAAYDNSDNILWSWHIWKVASNDIPGDVTFSNNAAGTFLDRNVGALSKDKTQGALTWGLFYQWGRKDPFLGNTSSGYKVAGTYSPSGRELYPKSMEYRNQNPTVYIYETTTVNASVKDNCDWGYTTESTSLSPNKTVNDPCPPGYAVSTGGKDIYYRTNAINTANYVYWYQSTPSFDSTNNGYEMATTTGTNWFPRTPYISYSANTTAENIGAYHTVDYNTDWFVLGSNAVTVSGFHTRVATPIRCQKL